MNLNQSRVGVLLAPVTTLWTGTVVTYDAAEFVLTVATVSGSLSALASDFAVFLADGRCARIRSVIPNLNTIVLAENPIEFAAPMSLSVYNVRLPFPRYQRVTEDGTVYKDFDIPFPGQYLAMPPTAVCVPEVIIAAVGESVNLTALDSVGMGVNATIVAYAWGPGAGGTIIGSGATVSVIYNTSGFRYLTLMIMDSNGALSFRYVPCWIGITPTPLTAARLTWRAGGGWSAEMEFVTTPNYLQRSPVAIVDLDTNEVLFFGFIHPQTLRYDFERQTLSLTALSALAYMAHIYSYPFLLTSVGVDEADEWAEVYNCTLQRATWFLLYWHSTIPSLANVTFESTARAIQGQEFQAGSLLSQLQTVCKAAFWQPRGARTGGMYIAQDPLYSADFGSLPGVVLTATDVEGEIDRVRPMNWISEARLSGVYYNAGWKPLIVRAPVHPEDIGHSEEVTNLAPLSSTELCAWAARHLGLAQTLQYDLTALIDIDPYSKARVILPDATEIALETLTLRHDAEKLCWQLTVSGRTYGTNVSTVIEPPLPPIIIPPPSPPPPLPPVPPIPPEPWGDGNIVAFCYMIGATQPVVYITRNFLDENPVWINITGNLSITSNVHFLDFAQGGDTPYGLYLTTAGSGGTSVAPQLFYCADPFSESPNWVQINPPAGYKFSRSIGGRPLSGTEGFVPRIMPNPIGDGTILCNIFDDVSGSDWSQWEASYAWIFRGAGITERIIYAGRKRYNYNYMDEMQWNETGDEILTTAIWSDLWTNVTKHLLSLPLDASGNRIVDYQQYSNFIQTYWVCPDALQRHTPAWMTLTKGVYQFAGNNYLTGNQDYDLGIAVPLCTTEIPLDGNASNNYGPDQYLQYNAGFWRVGINPRVPNTAVLTRYLSYSTSQRLARYTQNGFANGITATYEYPLNVDNQMFWTRNWVILPDGTGATYSLHVNTGLIETGGYVYRLNLTTGTWENKSGTIGPLTWPLAVSGAYLHGRHLMAVFWGRE